MIYVLDDDPNCLDLMMKFMTSYHRADELILQTFKHYDELVAYKTGQEVISILIFDINLDHENGLECIEDFKVKYPETSLICCSNYSDVLSDSINEHGVRHYLAKPFSKIQFHELLDLVLGERENLALRAS